MREPKDMAVTEGMRSWCRDLIALGIRYHEGGIGQDGHYRLANAGKGKSGLTFGGTQIDIGNNDHWRQSRERIWYPALKQQIITEQDLTWLEQYRTHPPDLRQIPQNRLQRLQQALNTVDGRQWIEEKDRSNIDHAAREIERVERALRANPSITQGLDPIAALALGIWVNQDYANNLKESAQWAATLPLAPSVTIILDRIKGFKYYHDNPRNWPHFLDAIRYAVQEGVHTKLITEGTLHKDDVRTLNALLSAAALSPVLFPYPLSA